MSNKMSLPDSSSSHKESFERILLIKNIKTGELTRKYKLCPREISKDC